MEIDSSANTWRFSLLAGSEPGASCQVLGGFGHHENMFKFTLLLIFFIGVFDLKICVTGICMCYCGL